MDVAYVGRDTNVVTLFKEDDLPGQVVDECLEHHDATCTPTHDCDTFIRYIDG